MRTRITEMFGIDHPVVLAPMGGVAGGALAAAARLPRKTTMKTVGLKHPEALVQSVRELWCARCGYGVVVRREPPECPLCRETYWRERPRLARYN